MNELAKYFKHDVATVIKNLEEDKLLSHVEFKAEDDAITVDFGQGSRTMNLLIMSVRYKDTKVADTYFRDILRRNFADVDNTSFKVILYDESGKYFRDFQFIPTPLHGG